ncbi:hypothetical protein D3C74_288870 [compost metagenome]
MYRLDQLVSKHLGPRAKSHFHPARCSKQVGCHRERRSFDIGKKQSGAAVINDPPVNFGQLQIGIDRHVDDGEVVFFLQRIDPLPQVLVTHLVVLL